LAVSKIGGLIAAASKKVTQPTLQLGGITVVERIVLTFQQMGLFPIAVVTGVEADEVKYRLAGRGVVFLYNEEFEDPELFASVKIGLAFLQGKCERIAFSPVNIPLFLPSTLRALFATEQSIVTPNFQGRGGHPVVFSDSVIPDILAWRGEEGLRGAFDSLSHMRAQIDVEDEGILLSIRQQGRLQEYYEENKAAFLHPRLRVGLEREEELFNARTKLLLLLIGETHSVRTAGNMMALSPSKAWDMLNRLEEVLGYPFIIRHRGGAQGSQSKLTPEGLAFLKGWQQYEEKIFTDAGAAFEQFRSVMEAPYASCIS
jgi:molybdate transport repressor ModE-like protein